MICNQDCKNCIYPDCINDELTAEDYKRSSKLDKKALDNPTTSQLKNRQGVARYDKKHREEKRTRMKEYYTKTAEKKIEAVRQWQKENREYLNAYQRERNARKKVEGVR